MNIVIVCYIYPPEVAPAGQMVKELSEDLSMAGHQVTVVTGYPNHPNGTLHDGWRMQGSLWEKGQGFRVLRVPHSTSPDRSFRARFRFYTSYAVNSLIAGLRLGRIDAVLCLSSPIVGAVSCWLLARLRRARFYYGIWDIYPDVALSTGMLRAGCLARALLALDTYLCRQADNVITISDGLKQTLMARGLPEDHVVIIPVWLDSDEIVPCPRSNHWRAEQSIADDKFVALYAGTIGLISGAQVMLDVADQLREYDSMLLLFVGEGERKQQLVAGAAIRGLPNMHFLPFQPRARLSEVQSTGDIGIVTLERGKGQTSVPSKVLGYMAAARPVIASIDDDSDTAAWIRAADCGWVVPAEDPQAIANVLLRAAANPDEAERRGRNGRQYLELKLNRTACTDAYNQLLLPK